MVSFYERMDQISDACGVPYETVARTYTLQQVQLKYHFLTRSKRREAEMKRANLLHALSIAFGGK